MHTCTHAHTYLMLMWAILIVIPFQIVGDVQGMSVGGRFPSLPMHLKNVPILSCAEFSH